MHNRLIIDNILIVEELTHALRNKMSRKEGFTTMKFNMSKAYDWVEWSILVGDAKDEFRRFIDFSDNGMCVFNILFYLTNGFSGDYFLP